ncbi:YvrJ family protein [Paenibacillus sp. strain BS8-2]
MSEAEVFSSVFSAISQVGFPIVITTYLLLRFEKKLETLTASILKLTEVIIKNTNGERHD